MNNHSIIQHALIVIVFSVVFAGGVVQSAEAADNNWFLGQMEQTDGYARPSAAPKMTDGNKFRPNVTPGTGANGYLCASVYGAYTPLNDSSDDMPGQNGSESSCGADPYIFSPNDITIAEYEADRGSAEKSRLMP